MPQPTAPANPEALSQIIRGLTETNKKLWAHACDLEKKCANLEERLSRLESRAQDEDTWRMEQSER